MNMLDQFDTSEPLIHAPLPALIVYAWRQHPSDEYVRASVDGGRLHALSHPILIHADRCGVFPFQLLPKAITFSVCWVRMAYASR